MTVDEKGYDAESHPIKDSSLQSQGRENAFTKKYHKMLHSKPACLQGEIKKRFLSSSF
jgi:hypothetical protein